jgi:protoporphyrin/coproporphyrin ferrochelatase
MSEKNDRVAIVLISHGTVDNLDDLPAFLANIRRGHPAPPELLAEVRRRYEAIGGQSPLNETSRAIAKKIEARLGVPVRFSNRLFHPYPKDVIAELVKEGRNQIVVVPLAQHSAKVYADAMIDAAKGVECTLFCAENWGKSAVLCEAFAAAIRAELAKSNPDAKSSDEKTTLLFTAHSLPKFIIDQGDPYERELQAAAKIIFDLLARPDVDMRVCFQSQGMSAGPGGRPVEWLGPDLKSALESISGAHPHSRVVVAPIGFLADHVEILYDLDIEAMGWARALGLSFSRTASLNDGEALVSAIEAIANPLVLQALQASHANAGASSR